jgi:hypothetical protein
MCLNIEVEKQKQRIIKMKNTLKKKYMIFFFLKSAGKVAGGGRSGRPVAVDGGWQRQWWLEMVAGPKSLGLKLVLKAL